VTDTRAGLPLPIKAGDIIRANWLNATRFHAAKGLNTGGDPFFTSQHGDISSINLPSLYNLRWGVVVSDFSMQYKNSYSDFGSDYFKVKPIDARGEVINEDYEVKVYFNQMMRSHDSDLRAGEQRWRYNSRALNQLADMDKVCFMPFENEEAITYGVLMFPEKRWSIQSDIDPSAYTTSDFNPYFDMTLDSEQLFSKSDLQIYTKGYVMMDETDDNLLRPWFVSKPYQPLIKILSSESDGGALNGPGETNTEWTYTVQLVKETVDDDTLIYTEDVNLTIEKAFNRLEKNNYKVVTGERFGNGIKWDDLSDANSVGYLLPAPNDAVYSASIIAAKSNNQTKYYATFQHENQVSISCAST